MTFYKGIEGLDGEGIPLQRLLWRSYLRMSLIPLFVIEFGFVITYWVSETVVYRKNVEAVSNLSRQYFSDISAREAQNISTSLEAIASHTRVFAAQTRAALDGDYIPPASERARYRSMPGGGLYTPVDNGTTASFYAGGTRVGDKELAKVWRLAALDPLMISIKNSNEHIASIYFNTYDSYNRIYPFVDPKQHYLPEMTIPSYNFYYEADAEHNPERRDVWTDAYIDPAGHGWMVSSIAPVWRGDKLEGVVGIDVTLATIIASLLDLDLPWQGYAMLVDDKGGIIALPSGGERDFGLDELTDHDYSEAILADTHKPEDFNIYKRSDTRALADAMRESAEGEVELDLAGGRLASFATVPQTGWRLVIVAPTGEIYAGAQILHDRLKTVGLVMLATLLAFYLLFFALLIRRARWMSRLIAEPLAEISDVIDHIADRRDNPRFAGSQIMELDRLGHHLVETRHKLIDAEDEARRQSRIAEDALVQVRAANVEMFSFVRYMSHEIRTPLSIIDGNAQIIDRKAGLLGPDDLRARAARLRATVAAVTELLSRLHSRFDVIAEQALAPNAMGHDPWLKLQAVVREAVPLERLQLSLSEAGPPQSFESAPFVSALQEVLGHIIAHSPAESPITIRLEADPLMLAARITGDAEVNGDGDLGKARRAIEEAGGKLSCYHGPERVTVTISVPSPVISVN